ncbi:unnamed protein product [Timema podura]|uniref:Uncharacterized protein n=1 Tax=Timema podura TaxID=61482 RepID=A0ABN7P4W7_TIMPD|nr:unnamed protein product [Timema podura]
MALMGTFYPGMKVNALDLSPNYAGTLMALVNGIGALSGIITPYLVGILTPDNMNRHPDSIRDEGWSCNEDRKQEFTKEYYGDVSRENATRETKKEMGGTEFRLKKLETVAVDDDDDDDYDDYDVLKSTLVQWRLVFWISVGVFLLTNFVFVFTASGEVQPWNSPSSKQGKEENANTTTQSKNVSHVPPLETNSGKENTKL